MSIAYIAANQMQRAFCLAYILTDEKCSNIPDPSPCIARELREHTSTRERRSGCLIRRG